MRLSNSGRIIIIDDEYEEAKPLFEVFGKYCIPFIFFDGAYKSLPATQFSGVRFVFLDIQLQGMAGQDPKTKASGLVNILNRIIQKDNGPYFIIFWTRHSDVIKHVINYCNTNSIPPIGWVDLEKNILLDNQNNYNLKKLTTKIRSKLSNIGAFQLYVEWENILNESSKDFINEFSNLIPPGANWSSYTSSLFFTLYKSFVEKNNTDDQKIRFRCAAHLMNRSFIDILESNTSSNLQRPRNFKLNGNNEISEDVKAKINSWLYMGKCLLTSPTTGCVYKANEKKIKGTLIKHFFKNATPPQTSILCKIIITPQCDLAQNKTLTIQKSRAKSYILHRIIYGLFYPISGSFEQEKRRLKNGAKFIFGPCWYNEKRYLLILNLATLSTQSEDEIKGKALFTLKQDILFDLQSKAANHINRLGNYQIQ